MYVNLQKNLRYDDNPLKDISPLFCVSIKKEISEKGTDGIFLILSIGC